MSKDAPPEELQSDFPPLDLSPLVEEAQEEVAVGLGVLAGSTGLFLLVCRSL